MKTKITILMLLCLTIISCSVENEEVLVSSQNFDATTNDNSRRVDLLPVICVSVDLIAGQNEIAGEVTLAKEGENITVTYTTIGDCENRPYLLCS
jgi:hypothetical protein